MLKEYLARSLAARINDLMQGAQCQTLILDCSISRLVKTKIFTDPLLIEKLQQYGITRVAKGKSDEYSVNYNAKHIRFKNCVSVCSGRIVNALCPNSRKQYDEVYTEFYRKKDESQSNEPSSNVSCNDQSDGREAADA